MSTFLSLTLVFSAIWHISRLQAAVMAICSLKIFSGYVVYKPFRRSGLLVSIIPITFLRLRYDASHLSLCDYLIVCSEAS